MEKVRHNGSWFWAPEWRSWQYIRPGEYDPSVTFEKADFEYSIDSRVVEQLIRALDEAGWIKPRLDERLRAEDLKITHRLLDLLGQVRP